MAGSVLWKTEKHHRNPPCVGLISQTAPFTRVYGRSDSNSAALRRRFYFSAARTTRIMNESGFGTGRVFPRLSPVNSAVGR